MITLPQWWPHLYYFITPPTIHWYDEIGRSPISDLLIFISLFISCWHYQQYIDVCLFIIRGQCDGCQQSCPTHITTTRYTSQGLEMFLIHYNHSISQSSVFCWMHIMLVIYCHQLSRWITDGSQLGRHKQTMCMYVCVCVCVMGFITALQYAGRSFRSQKCLSVRLSVRLSVCPSVMAWIVTKRKHLAKKVQLWPIGSRLLRFQWA